MMARPSETEYAEFYRGYVGLVPETDILGVLDRQTGELRRVAAEVPPEKEGYRYAPGKWSVRQVFGHMTDAERVLGYRAMCIARGEARPLPGFDENAYVESAPFEVSDLRSLLREFAHLRESHVAMFGRLAPEAWLRLGNANGKDVSVRALAHIMAGHVRHHLGILASRYGIPAA